MYSSGVIDKHEAGREREDAVSRTAFGFWALWWLIAIVSLWLKTGFPIHAETFQTWDDHLFVREAAHLGAGEWLGPYDNLTLAKGMGYPLFILLAFLLAVPLNIAEQVVYLAVAALTARLVLRSSNDRKLSCLLFAVLAFNPVVWNSQMAAVRREGLYLSLSLAAVILTIETVFPAPARRQWVNLRYGAALGLVLSAFWLTREEGAWLLPAIAVPISLSLLAAVTIRRPDGSATLNWAKSIGTSLAVAGTIFAACNGMVAGLNYIKYGVFITTELKSDPFLRAYGALARIKQDQRRRFVVFPKDARDRAYSVSPAARELAPVLEGPVGEMWRKGGCQETGTTNCPEILSGWFVWAFRDAVAGAGHYKSAPEAMRFYEELAREINAACASGRIPCGPPRATLMPVFHWQYLLDAARDSVTVAHVLLTMADMQIGTMPSIGSPSGIANFADAVGGVYPAHPTQLILQGWVASPSGEPQLTLKSQNGEQAEMTLAETPASDVTQLDPDWVAKRFDLRTGCPPAACALVVGAPGVPQVTVPLDGPHAVTTPTLRLSFESVRPSTPAAAKRVAVQLRIARVIAFFYARAFPALFALALVGYIVTLMRWRSRPISLALTALLTASLAAIAARILLLAYLDATSFPAATIIYSSAASPFVIVFTVIGCWCLAQRGTRKACRSAHKALLLDYTVGTRNTHSVLGPERPQPSRLAPDDSH